MNVNAKILKAIPLLATLMFLGGVFNINAEKDVSSVSWPILVNLSHMEFGDVYSGEKLEKTFTVSYSGKGNGNYSIQEKYKPKPGAAVPSGFRGTISDYCQVNHDDFDRCYKNLCPFIEQISREDEGDTPDRASVSAEDMQDTWTVLLNAPWIGTLSRDGEGGVISEGGEYGCDLSFNVGAPASDPVCGNAVKEVGEECDDGNNKNGDGCSASCKIEKAPCPSDKSSISGCKYNDKNSNGKIDAGEEKLGGWEIQLVKCPSYAPLSTGSSSLLEKSTINNSPTPGETGYCSVIASTVTGQDGCYSFINLEPGDYGVNEVNKNYWTQTYPASGKYYYFKLAAGQEMKSINFLNHQQEVPFAVCGNGKLEAGEQCDDGNRVNGDGCSCTCKIEVPVCGNGRLETGESCDDGNTKSGDGCSSTCSVESSGGGGAFVKLKITNEKVDSVNEGSAKFLWNTNIRSDSRVVCAEKAIPNSSLGSKPDYGYQFSTSTFDTYVKVASHNVTMYELKSDTDYYCRVISSANTQEALSTELTFRTEKTPIIPIYTPSLYIYNLTLQGLQKNQVSLKWNTNRNGTTCVVYAKSSKALGEKPKYGYSWMTGECENLGKQNTSHSTTIGGLEPCTTYYFRLTSTNGSQDAVTEEQQVKTLCQAPSAYYPRTYVAAASCTGTVASAKTSKCGCTEICDKGGCVNSCEEKSECDKGCEEGEECNNEGEEEGGVNGASDQDCECDCEECEATVKTVIEKERYMGREDWLILLIILVILTLLINALRSRGSRMEDDGILEGDNDENDSGSGREDRP